MPTTCAPATAYHETLWGAVQSAFDAIPPHHAVSVAAATGQARPMAYETSQRLLLPLEADARCPRGAKRSLLVVDLYRMPSGRYEVGAYAA